MDTQKNFIFFKVITVLISTFGSLFVVELGSNFFLKSQSLQSFDLFIAKPVSKEGCDQSFLTPIFGHTHSPCPESQGRQLPGYVVYPKDPTPNAIRIVALGGSTTDPVILAREPRVGSDNWPKILSELCDKNNYPCEIFNGGVGGFTSSQELLKLIRDGNAIKPDIVLSLHGINEYYFFKKNRRQYPYISKDQQNTLLSLSPFGLATDPYISPGSLMPNFMSAVKYLRRQPYKDELKAISYYEYPENFLYNNGISFGLAHSIKPASLWKFNVELMNKTAEELEAKYFSFLQPTMGVGRYGWGDQDKAIKENTNRRNSEYYPQINTLYNALIPLCDGIKFCFNLIDIFSNQKNIYIDTRHPDRNGNQRQAEIVFKIIEPEIKKLLVRRSKRSNRSSQNNSN